MFGTEQSLSVIVQQSSNSMSSFKPMFSSKTLRVSIARYCLRLSSSVLRMLGFLVKSQGIQSSNYWFKYVMEMCKPQGEHM